MSVTNRVHVVIYDVIVLLKYPLLVVDVNICTDIDCFGFFFPTHVPQTGPLLADIRVEIFFQIDGEFTTSVLKRFYPVKSALSFDDVMYNNKNRSRSIISS